MVPIFFFCSPCSLGNPPNQKRGERGHLAGGPSTSSWRPEQDAGQVHGVHKTSDPNQISRSQELRCPVAMGKKEHPFLVDFKQNPFPKKGKKQTPLSNWGNRNGKPSAKIKEHANNEQTQEKSKNNSFFQGPGRSRTERG